MNVEVVHSVPLIDGLLVFFFLDGIESFLERRRDRIQVANSNLDPQQRELSFSENQELSVS